MAVYDLKDQEEIENFKYFWRSWGRWLFALLVVAAIGYLGWVMYRSHQRNVSNEAVAVFDQWAENQQAGKPAPSIGFAMGVERLLLLVHEYGNLQADAAPDIYVIHQGGDTLLPSMQYAAAARAAGFSVLQHSGSQKLAAQMKKADASGAKVVLIVGEGELAEGKASLKDMQQGRGQVSVPAADLLQQLNEWIG